MAHLYRNDNELMSGPRARGARTRTPGSARYGGHHFEFGPLDHAYGRSRLILWEW